MNVDKCVLALMRVHLRLCIVCSVGFHSELISRDGIFNDDVK